MSKKSNRSRGNNQADPRPASDTSHSIRGFAHHKRWSVPRRKAGSRRIAAHSPHTIATCDNCYWTKVRKKDAEKYEPIVRQMINHENDLANYRITWLLTVEGFLLAALGFAWEKKDAPLLVPTLSLVGIVVALSAWLMLHLGTRAINRLRNWWHAECPKRWYRGRLIDKGPDVVGYWSRKWYAYCLLPSQVFPVLFLVVWVLIFMFYGTRFLSSWREPTAGAGLVSSPHSTTGWVMTEPVPTRLLQDEDSSGF